MVKRRDPPGEGDGREALAPHGDEEDHPEGQPPGVQSNDGQNNGQIMVKSWSNYGQITDWDPMVV